MDLHAVWSRIDQLEKMVISQAKEIDILKRLVAKQSSLDQSRTNDSSNSQLQGPQFRAATAPTPEGTNFINQNAGHVALAPRSGPTPSHAPIALQNARLFVYNDGSKNLKQTNRISSGPTFQPYTMNPVVHPPSAIPPMTTKPTFSASLGRYNDSSKSNQSTIRRGSVYTAERVDLKPASLRIDLPKSYSALEANVPQIGVIYNQDLRSMDDSPTITRHNRQRSPTQNIGNKNPIHGEDTQMNCDPEKLITKSSSQNANDRLLSLTCSDQTDEILDEPTFHDMDNRCNEKETHIDSNSPRNKRRRELEDDDLTDCEDGGSNSSSAIAIPSSTTARNVAQGECSSPVPILVSMPASQEAHDDLREYRVDRLVEKEQLPTSGTDYEEPPFVCWTFRTRDKAPRYRGSQKENKKVGFHRNLVACIIMGK